MRLRFPVSIRLPVPIRLTLSILAVAAVAASIPLAGRGSLAVAEGDGATTREFPDKNFSMSVPKGWKVADASADDQQSGYVCVVDRPIGPSVYVRAWYLVSNAGGTTLAGFLAQMKELKFKKLEDPTVLGPEPVTWGGTTDAMYMRIVGKTGGSKVASRVYAAIVSGRYHQLELKAYNLADDQVGEEMDAVAAGYRFLTGATTTPRVPADPKSKSGGGDSGGAAKTGADGLSMRFDAFALTWTLPKPPKEGDAPAWAFSALAAPHPGAGDRGTFGGAGADLLAVAVFAPTKGDATLQLSIRAGKAKPGFLPSALVGDEGNYDDMKRSLFEGTPVPSVDQDVSLGNWRGASRSYAGKGQDGKSLYLRQILATLKGNAYEIQVAADGGGEAKHLEDVKRALAGLAWDDVNEGVRGPWAAPFASVTEDRGDWIDLGKETVKVMGAVSLKKPASFGQVKFTATDEAFATWVFAFETRKPDAYLFVGIQRLDYGSMQRSMPPREPDSLIDEFENAWKNAMGDPKTLTQKAGKANRSPTGFLGAKGSQYRFEGVAEGKPFVELGWVVRAEKNVLWVRAQFGGKDAETTLGAEWKSLQRTIKIE